MSKPLERVCKAIFMGVVNNFIPCCSTERCTSEALTLWMQAFIFFGRSLCQPFPIQALLFQEESFVAAYCLCKSCTLVEAEHKYM